MRLPFVILVGALAGTLTACIPWTGDRDSLYVIIDPDDTNEFLEQMGSIAEAHGMAPYFAEQRGYDNVLHMLEATGSGLTLWLENMPFSGQEDPALCGAYGWPRVDPAQYAIYVAPRYIGNSYEKAVAVQASVAQRLESLGYQVLPDSVPCGRAVLLEQDTR